MKKLKTTKQIRKAGTNYRISITRTEREKIGVEDGDWVYLEMIKEEVTKWVNN